MSEIIFAHFSPTARAFSPELNSMGRVELISAYISLTDGVSSPELSARVMVISMSPILAHRMWVVSRIEHLEPC